MFLKTLRIKGFKSFADTTDLALEPGVTVVVGPNGSGKSNVVDAIGWVLGAQAPSAVRSQKMDDVIFAGSQKRPALGRAEVALTIDNSAGLLPIEFTEVTITRTLFRSGDSEYALNGVPCRLLDIQEILSDTGVGRQQHVIISQGQIDAVLNARPEERRLIIEEAAGVLKFRRRKEKAERRLAATEANLTRLQDLLREVRRQLRPLERQADAARRHGAVAAELTALRRYLAGQELTRLRARVEAGQHNRRSLDDAERALRERLRQLDAEVVATEAQLSAMGGDDLGDALVRFESLREKARGLAAVLAERRRGIERDRGAMVDREVIANLEAEAARLTAEVADVDAQAGALVPEANQLTDAESASAADRTTFESDWSRRVTAPSGRAAEVRAELMALGAANERGSSEAGRLHQRLDVLAQKMARFRSEDERLHAEQVEAEQEATDLAELLRVAEADRAADEERLVEAERRLRQADAERHRWTARDEALASALAEGRARAGAERLAGIDGVVGTLLELVDVDPGWELAFEAAAGEAIAAVVVDSVDVARHALESLRRAETNGAVLALHRSGPTLPAGGPLLVSDQVPVPGGLGPSLRSHVRGRRAGVDELLDVLMDGVVVVDDWKVALDVVVGRPQRVVVTIDGDRFGPAGWRIGAVGSGATGAALDEARRQAEVATEAAAVAQNEVETLRVQVEQARAHFTDITRRVDRNIARSAAVVEGGRRARREHDDTATEAQALQAQRAELDARLRRERERTDELAATLPVLEAEEAAQAAQGQALAEARTRLEEKARAVALLRTDLEVRAAGLDDRRQFLQRRLADVDERLSRDIGERRDAEAKRVELEARAIATERLAAFVAERLVAVEAELDALRERRRLQSEATRAVVTSLEALRRDRSIVERELSEVRERRQRAELDDTETRLRLEAAVESARRDLDCEPETAMATPAPVLAEQVSPSARVRELERDLRLMGPINPLALEEFEALQERHAFVEGQLEDVKSGRRDLGKVIRAIDGEIVHVFAAAFADVSQNFAALFETLFPGGSGSLVLTDPDNLLDTGIEVEARPSGKNVRKLSLLSGGERSLTALAYLFAVFRSRPSPFYVMDEVEAALDDVNLHRFLDLVHEFRAEAQLIIVTHQKRTMEAADCLYGVTMEPGGSSRVISERVAVR